MSSRLVVAIDQSITQPGFCILLNGEIMHSKSARIRPTQPRLKRFSDVTDEFQQKILDAYKCNKDPTCRLILVREQHNFSTHGNANILHQLNGWIDRFVWDFMALLNEGITCRYYEIPNTTWKKVMLGKGNFKKDTAYLLEVYKRHNVEFEDDNCADAYLIAKTAEMYDDEAQRPDTLKKRVEFIKKGEFANYTLAPC